MVQEEVKVDWRAAPKARGGTSGISGLKNVFGGKKEEEST
jgi:hypothetical protein